MTADIKRQLAELGANPSRAARAPAATPKAPTAPSAARQAREKRAQVALAPRKPVRWEVASGLHTQQYAGRFRVVVMGHILDLDKVISALEQLQP